MDSLYHSLKSFLARQNIKWINKNTKWVLVSMKNQNVGWKKRGKKKQRGGDV